MVEQLGFDLFVWVVLGCDDFFVFDVNVMVLVMVDSWLNWVGNKFVIIGLEGSGKIYLVYVWVV